MGDQTPELATILSIRDIVIIHTVDQIAGIQKVLIIDLVIPSREGGRQRGIAIIRISRIMKRGGGIAGHVGDCIERDVAVNALLNELVPLLGTVNVGTRHIKTRTRLYGNPSACAGEEAAS